MSERFKNIGVLIIGFLIIYWFTKTKIFLYIPIVVGVLSLISSTLADWILKIWFAIGHIMGSIMSKIILTVVYYFILCPIAFLYQLFKNDPMSLRQVNKKKDSLFIIRKHTFTKKDIINPW